MNCTALAFFVYVVLQAVGYVQHARHIDVDLQLLPLAHNYYTHTYSVTSMSTVSDFNTFQRQWSLLLWIYGTVNARIWTRLLLHGLLDYLRILDP